MTVRRLATTVLGRIEAVVASILLAIMVVIVFLDVLLRYLFDSPLTGTAEYASVLFVWVVLLGSASAARRRLHVGVRWFVERLSGTARVIAERAGTGVIVAILLVTAWFGIELMNSSGSRTLPLTDLPLRLIYAAVPVGCVLTAIAYLVPPVVDDEADDVPGLVP